MINPCPARPADERADVDDDGETPVVEDYGIPAPYKFTGKIGKVSIELKETNAAERTKEDKLLRGSRP